MLHKRGAIKCVDRLITKNFKQGGEDVGAGCKGADRLAAAAVRRTDNQRDVIAGGVKSALAEHPVIPHHFGMIGGKDEDRILPEPARLEAGNQAAMAASTSEIMP